MTLKYCSTLNRGKANTSPLLFSSRNISNSLLFHAMGLNNTVHPYGLAQENNTTTRWSIADNKAFETGLGKYDKDPNKWLLVATMTLGKTVADVFDHYGKLVEDINQIEGGAFDAELWRFDDNVNEYAPSSPATFQEVDNRLSNDACRERPASVGDSSDKETKKKGGPHWTEDEHRRFMIGLQDHGNKWTLISREYVKTKTPQQVASHAQKYFARQEKTPGENESRKRRRSIHDITIETVASNMMKQSHHMPAPAPHRNHTTGVGIPQVPQSGWINHHNGISSENLNSAESPDSTFHVAPIGFNPNGQNMSDTSCYESHVLAPQQKQNSTEDVAQQELEYWVEHYNELVWMDFNSNADNTFKQSSFGFSTDDPVDLPPFP